MASITYNTNKYFNGTIKDFMAKYNALHNNATTKKEAAKFDDAITFIGNTKSGIGEGLMIKMEASDGTKTPVYFKTLGSGISLMLTAKSGATYSKTANSNGGALSMDLSTSFLDNVYLNKSASSSFRAKNVSAGELKDSLMSMWVSATPLTLENFKAIPANTLGGQLKNTYIRFGDNSSDRYKQSPLLYSMVPTRQDHPEIVYFHKLYTYPCVENRQDPSDKSPKVYVYEGDIINPLDVKVSFIGADGKTCDEYMYDCDNIGYFTTERKIARTTNYLLENKQDKRSDIDTFRALLNLHTDTKTAGVTYISSWFVFTTGHQTINSGNVITAGNSGQSPIIYKLGQNYAYIPKLHSLGRTADMSPKVYLLQDDINGVGKEDYVMYNHQGRSKEYLIEEDNVGVFTTERRLAKMVMYLSRQVQALTQEITNLKTQLGMN